MHILVGFSAVVLTYGDVVPNARSTIFRVNEHAVLLLQCHGASYLGHTFFDDAIFWWRSAEPTVGIIVRPVVVHVAHAAVVAHAVAIARSYEQMAMLIALRWCRRYLGMVELIVAVIARMRVPLTVRLLTYSTDAFETPLVHLNDGYAVAVEASSCCFKRERRVYPYHALPPLGCVHCRARSRAHRFVYQPSEHRWGNVLCFIYEHHTSEWTWRDEQRTDALCLMHGGC